MRLSDKQLEIMRVIAEGNEDGTDVDMDQLLERINYETSKQSMQFSIRALTKHGLIEKVGKENRRDRQRVLFGLTPLGSHFGKVYAKPRAVMSILEPSDLLTDELI